MSGPEAAGTIPGGGRVLVVDGTGRGHAICDLFVRTSPGVTVFYGPGCDLLDVHPQVVPVPAISPTDVGSVLRFLRDDPVELVFVSHIEALSRGLADELRRAGHRAVGPSAVAARLETSKAFGKEFCERHGVPVPAHHVFTDPSAARAHVTSAPYRCVVKVDGLTPDGDGSVVCDSTAEALAAVDRFAAELGDRFHVVVEERLTGQEVSVFGLLDGTTALMLPLAMDYKRALEDDLGKNCDGMGSISPHPQDSPALREMLRTRLLDPVVAGLATDGLEFTGFIYLGAMLTERGPVVIEINARFGDSEAQVVLPALHNDFLALNRAVLAGTLAQHDLHVDALARCSVALVQGEPDADAGNGPDVAASTGWPWGSSHRGHPVVGLDRVDTARADVFYANVHRGALGGPVTGAGRVAHVVGRAPSAGEARRRAYAQVERIWFPGMRYRRDIGATGVDAPAGSASRTPPAPLQPVLSGQGLS